MKCNFFKLSLGICIKENKYKKFKNKRYLYGDNAVVIAKEKILILQINEMKAKLMRTEKKAKKSRGITIENLLFMEQDKFRYLGIFKGKDEKLIKSNISK